MHNLAGGAVFAKRTASEGRSRSRIELRGLKWARLWLCKSDSDYALHNDCAKFMQSDYAKFRQTVVPLLNCILCVLYNLHIKHIEHIYLHIASDYAPGYAPGQYISCIFFDILYILFYIFIDIFCILDRWRTVRILHIC